MPRLATPCLTLLVLLATACQTGVEATRVPERSASLEAPLVHASGAREVTLDVRDAVRLVGVLEEAPADSDADRVLVLHVSGGASIDPALEGARVLDARFVDEGIATIGTDHVLRLHRNGHAIELDQLVEPPLSVAVGALAYARGYPPNLEIARIDLATGTAVAVTQGMNPAWSPALTPDGSAIVFVSGLEGTARFYRSEDGAIRALPRTERTPSAPVAPRFEDGLLHFADEQGEVWVDLERGAVVRDQAMAGAR